MTQASIIKATMADFADIQRLNHLLFIKEQKDYDHNLNTDWPLSEVGIEYFEKQLNEIERVVFVAKDGDNTVGYIAGSSWNESTFENNGLVACLENFYVEEHYRSRGIGSQLVNSLKNWAKELGARRMVVTASHANDRAIQFYKRQGFEDFDIKLKLEL